MPTRRHFLSTVAATAVAATLPLRARAATWPTAGPIRMVVASGAGGNADVVARIVAAELEPLLGQTIVVENLAAASGMEATEAVGNAAPDGYTILVGTSSQLVHNIALFDPLPVDIRARLRGVAMMNEVPMVLCVAKDDPATDLAAFIDRIKADAPAFQYGSGPTGTTTHITGALFLSQIGAEVLHVPYPKSSEAMADLIAGRLTFMFDPSLTAVPQISSPRLSRKASSSAMSGLPVAGTDTRRNIDTASSSGPSGGWPRPSFRWQLWQPREL